MSKFTVNKKTVKKIGFAVILLFLVVQPLLMGNIDMTSFDEEKYGFNTKDENDKITSNPDTQSSSTLLTLPFYRNDSAIKDWMDKLEVDDNTTIFKGFYDNSSQSGDIRGDKVYFESTAVGFDGLFNYYGVPTTTDPQSNLEYYSQLTELKDSQFYNESAKLFNSYLDESNNFQDSTIMEANGNAQLILTLADAMNEMTSTTYHKEYVPLLKDQWSGINNNLFDNYLKLYNQSNVNSEKITEDNLILAIAGFLTHRINDNIISDADGVKSNANASSTLIMKRLMADQYVNGAFNDSNMDDGKSLITNAYAIWALCEMYIESGADENAEYLIELAESTFMSINNTLWNSSYSLYMNKATQSMYYVGDYGMNTKDNAVMITALQRLFEITGNLTYYNQVITLLDGIQNNLMDSVWGNYYEGVLSGLIPANAVYNESKTISAHANLYRAFHKFERLSRKYRNSITLEPSGEEDDEIILYETTEINVTIKNSFKIDIVNTEAGIDILNVVDLVNTSSELTYVIRNPDGEIIDSLFYTPMDENGTYSFTIPLDSSYDLIGEYKISFDTNTSYINVRSNETTFTIYSKVDFVKADTSILVDGVEVANKKLVIGDIATLNVSIANLRKEDMNFTLSCSGEYINNNETLIRLNGTESDEAIISNHTLNFQVDYTAEIGSSIITIELINNSLVFATYNLTFTVISLIEVTKISTLSNYVRDYDDNQLIITIHNLVDNLQLLQIKLEGDKIETVSINISISTGSNSYLTTTLDLDVLAEYLEDSDIEYSINITGQLNDYNYYYKEFSMDIVNAVEFEYLSIPNEISTFTTLYVEVVMINNLDINQTVEIIFKNRDIPSEYTLTPGENKIIIKIENFNNPYKLGEEIVSILIKDSNGNILYDFTHVVSIRPSIGSVFWGYIFPFLIPVIGLVVIKHYQLEHKKQY